MSGGQVEICDYTDFPSFGQTLRELVLQGDKAAPRKPANESLLRLSSVVMIIFMETKA